ncbi:MAG TPA: glycosyltransferase, partial [Anaerolineales bacterium]
AYYRAPEQAAMLQAYVQNAALVRVYSQRLQEKVREFNENVVRVEGVVDWRLLRPPRRQALQPPIRIVYATSRSKDNLAPIFSSALKRVLEENGSRVEAHFLGYFPPEFRQFPNVRFRPLTLNYRRYMGRFSSAGYDIGLAPMLDDPFHRSKTNLKVREYGACRIAGIFSNVEVYSAHVADGRTGILVNNDTAAWYGAISILLEHSELRASIQEQAYAYAREHFPLAAFTQVWQHQMIDALRLGPARPKLVSSPATGGRASSASAPSVTPGPHAPPAPPTPAVSRRRQVALRAAIRRRLRHLPERLWSDGSAVLWSVFRGYIEQFWVMLQIQIALLQPRPNAPLRHSTDDPPAPP